mgnify:CR=1 FL=1
MFFIVPISTIKEGSLMADYKKMYCLLFHQITQTIESLKEAQRKSEEIYISSQEQLLSLKHVPDNDPPNDQ